jgi:hypothetical protein
MPSRRFPKPWTVEPMPSGYRIIDGNGIVLAYVYGQPDGAIAVSEARLTDDEARRISRLISRLLELEGPQQGGEPSQAAAVAPQAGDDWRPDQGGEAARGSLRQLQAGASPLPQSRDLAPRQAHARAGGSKPPCVLEMRARNTNTDNPIWAQI